MLDIGYSPALLLICSILSAAGRPPIIAPTSAKVTKISSFEAKELFVSAYLEMIKKNLKNLYFFVKGAAHFCNSTN